MQFGQNILSLFLSIFGSIGVLKIMMDMNFEDMYQNTFFFLIFISVIFFVYCLGWNLSLTKNEMVCDSMNTSLAIQATVFPYVFIYVLGLSLLFIFPGWLRSFENTFGLTIVHMCGYSLEKFISKDHIGNKPADTEAKIRLYDSFVKNPDVLMNEISLQGNDDNKKITETYINLMTHITGSDAVINLTEDHINTLKKYVTIKKTVAIMIWVLLLGMLTLLVSQNTLLNNNCQKKVEDRDEFKKYVTNQLRS